MYNKSRENQDITSKADEEFFNNNTTKNLMINYLEKKHKITEINGKKITSYNSIFNKEFLKKYIEDEYGISDYVSYIRKNKNNPRAEQIEQKQEKEEKEEKVKKEEYINPVELRLRQLIDHGFTDQYRSRAINSGDENQNDQFNYYLKAMSKDKNG